MICIVPNRNEDDNIIFNEFYKRLNLEFYLYNFDSLEFFDGEEVHIWGKFWFWK